MPSSQLHLHSEAFCFLLSSVLSLLRQHFGTSMHLSASACAGACILLEKGTVPRALCVTEVRKSLEWLEPS